VTVITMSPELLCMDTMTEVTYSSNHFFDGIHTHFDITRAFHARVDHVILAFSLTQQERAMNHPDIAHLSAA